MINHDAIEAFNTRITANLNNIKTMTPSQQDAVKDHGSQAEALLKNKQLAMFIHQFKFELCDQLASINGYTVEDNNKRIAISNQIGGIDSFISTLQRAVYLKNRVVTIQTQPEKPAHNFKESEVL